MCSSPVGRLNVKEAFQEFAFRTPSPISNCPSPDPPLPPLFHEPQALISMLPYTICTPTPMHKYTRKTITGWPMEPQGAQLKGSHVGGPTQGSPFFTAGMVCKVWSALKSSVPAGGLAKHWKPHMRSTRMFGPIPTWAPVCTTGLIGILGSQEQQHSFRKVRWTVYQTELHH